MCTRGFPNLQSDKSNIGIDGATHTSDKTTITRIDNAVQSKASNNNQKKKKMVQPCSRQNETITGIEKYLKHGDGRDSDVDAD